MAHFPSDVKDTGREDFLVSSLTYIRAQQDLDLAESRNFSEIAYSQQLVMGFARINAFISDSIRAICTARPAVLKTGKKAITWERLVDLSDWDSVFSHMVEEYVYKLGWDSVVDVVDDLNDRLGLQVALLQDTRDRIYEAELLRNVVIHCGGQASAEYLARTKRKDAVLGQKMTIDRAFVDQVFLDLLLLG